MGTRGRGSSPSQPVCRVVETTGVRTASELRVDGEVVSRPESRLAAEDGLDWGRYARHLLRPSLHDEERAWTPRPPARATRRRPSERYDRPLRVRDRATIRAPAIASLGWLSVPAMAPPAELKIRPGRDCGVTIAQLQHAAISDALVAGSSSSVRADDSTRSGSGCRLSRLLGPGVGASTGRCQSAVPRADHPAHRHRLQVG
jgi:hypothetical protein